MKNWFYFLIFLGLWCSSVDAKETSFHQALQTTFKSDTLLQKLRDQGSLIRLQYQELLQKAYIPTVNLSYSYDSSRTSLTTKLSTAQELGLSYNIYDGGLDKAKYYQANDQKEMNRIKIQSQERFLEWDLIQPWLDYWKSENQIQILKEATIQSKKEFERLKKRKALGYSTKLGVLQFQVSWAQNLSLLKKEKTKKARLYRKIQSLTGIKEINLDVKPLILLDKIKVLDFKEYREIALKNRIELRQFDWAIVELKHKFTQTQSILAPQVYFSLSSQKTQTDTETSGVKTSSSELNHSIGLQVSYRWGGHYSALSSSIGTGDTNSNQFSAEIQFFPGHGTSDSTTVTSNSRVLSASLAIRAKKKDKKEKEKSILQELENAYQFLQDALNDYQLNQLILKKEKENFRVEKSRYDSGLSTEEKYIDAQTEQNRAKAQLNHSKIELQKKWFGLRYTSGLDLLSGK
ncbi:MAG: outer membrane protein TolC [bacterium]|jgi:outer membrane protein TolC